MLGSDGYPVAGDDLVTGRIHSVETLGATDGPGLRYVVFLQGCPLSCSYCHNPDTRVMDAGERVSARELCDDILRYKNYLSGGMTFSGGEPLSQPQFVSAVCRILHNEAKMHCAIDTSGALYSPDVLQAIGNCDLILLDMKAFDENTALHLTGSDTKNAHRILDFAESVGKPVFIRHVLVPGYTIITSDENDSPITEYGKFVRYNQALCDGVKSLSRYRQIDRIDLLPYHKLGEFKWEESGGRSPLHETPEPSEESVAFARKIVAEHFRRS